MDEQRIREIVREELAARKEQPGKQNDDRTYLSDDHKWKCEIGISTPI